MRFTNARVEKRPSNIRMQWNAGTACVSECVLKTLARRGLRVGPSEPVSMLRWIKGPPEGGSSGCSLIRVGADVWKKDVWDFQAKSKPSLGAQVLAVFSFLS